MTPKVTKPNKPYVIDGKVYETQEEYLKALLKKIFNK